MVGSPKTGLDVYKETERRLRQHRSIAVYAYCESLPQCHPRESQIEKFARSKQPPATKPYRPIY